MHKNTVFNNLLQEIPRHKFNKSVQKHNGDKYVKHFNCFKLFVTLLYAQIKKASSLREIVYGLKPKQRNFYHLGLELVKRSTLSEAMSKRPYQVFEELFYIVLSKCELVTPKHKFKFKNKLHSIDSTTIDLCLSVFSWAKFRKRKGAIKLHYSLDHDGMIPNFLVLSEGKKHDAPIAKKYFKIIPDSIYVFDKAYVDYNYLKSIDNNKAFFVTRIKKNCDYKITGQQKVPNRKGLISDYTIKLEGFYTKQKYPNKLRLVKYHDEVTNKTYEFITNNFKLAAKTIAQIYKERWQIELFFKWIKQNLKIKSFLGTTKNAVMTQIWVAMIYYLLLAFFKHQTKFKGSLLELNILIKEALFDKMTIIDLLNLTEKDLPKIRSPIKMQMLLGF